jgi:L-amino acid N-acyltransferase YncA
MKGFRIRTVAACTPADLDGLADVLIDCVQAGASVSFMLPMTHEKAALFWRSVAEDALRRERILVVAEDDAGIVGTVQILLNQPENQPHRADLAKMLVHQRARRQGVGGALLQAAEQAAHAAGKRLLVLDTASPDAERLYARGGWQACGYIPGYARMPDGAPCGTRLYFKELGACAPHTDGAPVQFIECTHEAHAAQILDIFNEAIENSTALYDYQPRTIDSMAGWFKTKQAHRFPVIGAVDSHGALLGFASFGTFRAWPAYKYSVEHSVYIHQNHRGQGLGRALMQRLIAAAVDQQYHLMVGGIDMANTGSIQLHEKLGFTHAGTIRQGGFKFGRWLDLGLYQLLLPTPTAPVDG